jgi:3-dehydroquinate synthase
MIEIDEFDKGPRNVFNYGHSFGHALETATNFAIPHGIAVCFGMDLANTISNKKNLITLNLRNELRDIYEMVWREDTPDDLNISLFFDSLSKDKKNEGAEIKVILTRGLGAMFKTTLSLDDNMHTFIESYFHNKVWGKAL